MKIFSILILFLLFNGIIAQAQNVGIGTNTPDPTAKLHVESSNSGMLMPRLTTTQRNGIASPAHGLIIFNTTDSVFQFWNGQCWLSTHQPDCYDCTFDMTFSQDTGVVDRIVSDSATVQITLSQNTGNPQNIAFDVINSLPNEMFISFSQNPTASTSTITMTTKVLPFIQGGTYPVIVKAYCGNYSQTFIYTVYVEPCYRVSVLNSTQNYDLSTGLYTQYPSAPTTQPICVIADIDNGAQITSNTTASPAFTAGSLPAGSLVAILNNGYILGKGGNGGTAYSPTSGTSGAGFDGGSAINLTTKTYVQNNLGVYGGGGGGNAMAFEISWTPPPPGNIVTLGIFLGSGGGGGAGGPQAGIGGLGGNAPGGIVGFSFYTPGNDATAGATGVKGLGGLFNYPIPINLGPVSMSLSPNATGGNGGDYGYPGTQGAFDLRISASIVINIPFIGPITIPVANNIAIPIPVPPPPAGLSGFAVKRNGNDCNIPDNHYTTSGVKGRVGN
ncbi:MAG: hypothetical protein GY810_25235 [Aureispira sp.]|nr:hypothetical protein [Aureispira sp.]